MAIGQELLEIPFADMVRNLAAAVAEGQFQLDQASLQTLKFLMDDKNAVSLVPEITEIVEKASRSTVVSTPAGTKSVPINSVNVRQEAAPPVKMTLLQAGLMPTFYQFTEAMIEVKLSISMKQTNDAQTAGRPGFAGRSVMAYGSAVNFRSASTYSYTAEGSSLLRITMKPVPAPARLMPELVTINALNDTPTVARNTA